MTNLCFQVEGYVSPFAKQLPKIQTEDLIYIEKFEEDVYGHWLFGNNVGTLIDKVNSRSLIVQPGASVQPTYSDEYVSLSIKDGNALVSDLLDSAVSQFTMSGLFMPNSTNLSTIMGNLAAASGETATGFGIFTSAGKLYATIRTQVSSWDVGIALDPVKPVFASISINKTTGIVNFVAQQAGIFYEKTTPNLNYLNAGVPFSFGNNRFPSSFTNTNKMYEGIIHDKALSIDEIKMVANRMKIRQEQRGIIF
ncbi:hypothetical protein ABFP25_01190 [Acinetobacter indicus]|uniref:hypothetical protein n=1 Tax=Acinetobacter indicus TaxID=756892 RepID=UPI003212F570